MYTEKQIHRNLQPCLKFCFILPIQNAKDELFNTLLIAYEKKKIYNG